jgi:hypothetical protein
MIVSSLLAGFKRLIEHVVATFIVAAQHDLTVTCRIAGIFPSPNGCSNKNKKLALDAIVPH